MTNTTRNALTKAEGSDTIPGYLLASHNTNLDTIDAAIAKANWNAAVPPTATDDADAGYAVGSFWYDATSGYLYWCTDATADAAVWETLWPIDTSGIGASMSEEGDIPYWTGLAIAALHHSTFGYGLLSGGHGEAPYFDSFPVTGWVGVAETWTYSSADAPLYVFTVSGDVTDLYQTGLKLKCVQAGTTRYFAVASSAYVAPYTYVTIDGFSDYELANAVITSPCISFGMVPRGWPVESSSSGTGGGTGDFTSISASLVYTSWDADSNSGTMTATGADLSGVIQVKDKITLIQSATAKYFLVSKVAYAGGNTVITIYGGTDYDLANSAITGQAYSRLASPSGFPTDHAKWDIILTDTTARGVGPASVAYFYADVGSLHIHVPIGEWVISIDGMAWAQSYAAASFDLYAGLSTANNSWTITDLRVYLTGPESYGYTEQSIAKSKAVTLTAITAYYLIAQVTDADTDSFGFPDDSVNLVIKATCNLL